jgi:hypothetical protein
LLLRHRRAFIGHLGKNRSPRPVGFVPPKDRGIASRGLDMKKRNLSALGLCLVIGVVACGGDDKSNSSGTSGSSATGGSSSSTGGGSSKAGDTSTAGKASTGGGSGAELETDLPGEKPVDSLTDDEIAGLCDEWEKLFSEGAVGDSLKQLSCSIGGVVAGLFSGAKSDAELQAACQAAVDDCVAAPAESSGAECKPSGTCTATVAELQACAADSAAALVAAVEQVPGCDALTMDGLSDLGTQPRPGSENPESCRIAQEKCPDGFKPPRTGEMP